VHLKITLSGVRNFLLRNGQGVQQEYQAAWSTHAAKAANFPKENFSFEETA
jgi:hypothetical protein